MGTDSFSLPANVTSTNSTKPNASVLYDMLLILYGVVTK